MLEWKEAERKISILRMNGEINEQIFRDWLAKIYWAGRDAQYDIRWSDGKWNMETKEK